MAPHPFVCARICLSKEIIKAVEYVDKASFAEIEEVIPVIEALEEAVSPLDATR